MALYEDDSMVLRNPGEAAPEGFVSKGMMGPEGEEQEYYERAKSPTVGGGRELTMSRPDAGGQEQASDKPPMGDFKQFMDWVMKNQMGFNPYTMNPVTDAMQTWSKNEAKFFNDAFSGTGITPSSMTPDALKFWNEQKKEGLDFMLKEAQNKQVSGVKYLEEFKKEWENQNELTSLTTVDKTTGKEVYVNKAGKPSTVEKPGGSERGQYVGTQLDSSGNPVAIVFNPKSGEFKTQPFPEGKAPLPKMIADKVKDEIGSVNQTQDLVDGLERQWTSLGIKDRTDAITAYAMGKTGGNPTAKTYNDIREAFLGQLSRSIAAERGVLTNQDIDRIKKALPALGINPLSVDNAEEAAKKWKEIYTVIENAKKRTWEKAGISYNSVVEPRSKQADKYFDKKETKETKGEAVKKEKSVVGRRKSASGRTIVKYDDGTYGEE